MEKEDKEATIRYGTHASTDKEADFIRAELAKQMQAGNVDIFALEAANTLHNLWLYLVAVISQVGRRPYLIFDFTWSGINDVSNRLAPKEAMRFGGAPQRILKEVLTANPHLGTV